MQAKRRVRVHSSPSSSHLHGGGEGAQRRRRIANPRPATSSGSQSASFAWAGVVGAGERAQVLGYIVWFEGDCVVDVVDLVHFGWAALQDVMSLRG